ncbi:MAG: hypothetical protein Q9M33_03370 [Robiginitomaculum sp.]|nr:hypothetical protein [Robiginitomaculum sp.]MDQ7077522.1 hypothetical protein [Robiginitomaculum sp.]
MINSKTLSALAPWITLGVLALSVWKWLLDSQFGSNSFNLGFLTGFLPIVWIGITIKNLQGRLSKTAHLALTRSISLAGLILGIPLILAILQNYHLINGGVPIRLNALFFGAFIIIIGNAIPKALEPLGESQCSPVTEQALKRFGGWMFVIGGLGYAFVWLILPVPMAKDWALPVLALPLMLLIARTFMVRVRHTQR